MKICYEIMTPDISADDGVKCPPPIITNIIKQSFSCQQHSFQIPQLPLDRFSLLGKTNNKTEGKEKQKLTNVIKGFLSPTLTNFPVLTTPWRNQTHHAVRVTRENVSPFTVHAVPFYSPGPQGGYLGGSQPMLTCVILCFKSKTVKIPHKGLK